MRRDLLTAAIRYFDHTVIPYISTIAPAPCRRCSRAHRHTSTTYGILHTVSHRYRIPYTTHSTACLAPQTIYSCRILHTTGVLHTSYRTCTAYWYHIPQYGYISFIRPPTFRSHSFVCFFLFFFLIQPPTVYNIGQHHAITGIYYLRRPYKYTPEYTGLAFYVTLQPRVHTWLLWCLA